MTLVSVVQPRRLTDIPTETASTGAREVLSEDVFKRMIVIERKRTERTKEPFLLMLVEAGNRPESRKNEQALQNVASALMGSTRETDVIGWYSDRTIIGVMYTGLSAEDKGAVLSMILNRVSTTLRAQQMLDQFNQVSLSFHFFPDDWDHDGPGNPTDSVLYPDLLSKKRARKTALFAKRVADVMGSALALVLCSPVLLIIALAVKLTSKGPVLFRQQRVGQHGKLFTFLKFRSMRVENDHTAHKEFVTKLIRDEIEKEQPDEADKPVYKLTNDKRITSVGRFLRRTSLDELPQFFNVLKGEMSLVGPRPPIPYELAVYRTWHRRRVLEVKPGITGPWQVAGRSRVKFDEMVRLDLRYAMTWTPWLDIKILLLTPFAVIKGAGAC